MGDQPLYKPNHSGNSTDDDYYQQQPNPMATMSGGLNHNYGSSSLEPPQSSPVSPQFPHDPLDSSAGAAMPVSAKGFPGMTEASKETGPWGSLVNLMWGSSSPGEATDPGSVGGYQYSCTAQTAADGQPKVTSSVLQKLDSFTQVFANQNLRIHQGSTGGNGHSLAQHGQSASPSSLTDVTADRALRQLLSQKPHLHEETPVQQQQRYQVEQQQMQRSFDTAQPKSQQITDVQQQLYYEYQQQQLQQQRVAQMQHLQALQQRQQMQSLQSQQQMQQHQQAQYYLQQQQKPQQQTAHALLQQLQQQRSTYYHKQAQAAMHQLQLQQQQQQMQPLASPSPYHQNRKTVQQQLQYAHQEQAHPVQHIQLSSGADPYYYQEQQQQSASTQLQYHRQVYQQNIHLQQQVQAQEEHALQSPPKQYLLEPGCQPRNPGVPAAAAVSGLPEGRNDGLACREVLPNMGVPSPPHQLGQRCLNEALSTMQLASSKGGPQKQQSPSTLWPQVSLTTERRDPTSPDHSVLNNAGFPERVEVKNKLVCSMCQKEFKSLPALNGHMRSHGGTRTAPSLKQDEGDKQLPKEVDPLLPIVMPVSVPVKLPPAVRPAADLSPAPCCPPDRDMPVLVRMAESPPPASLQLLQQPPHSPGTAHPASSSVRKTPKTEKAEDVNVERGQPDKKKYRHRPDPLIIPPPSFSLALGGAILFQSQLRSPRILGEIPPYTPPPMLSPVRHAPGLFSSVLYTGMPPITATPRVLLGRASSADGSSIPVTPGPGEQAVNIEPHINIGPQFQAQIPELQSRSAVEGDQHKASMVWTPRAELQSPGARQRVEDFVNMACSSVVSGGGTNSEYALHCLFETRGDFMAAVEKLLLCKTMRPKSHPLADYHYAGSDKWAPLEKKQFNKALATHNKDFFHVQKTVKTKTVAQCVEYYYTWKKKLRLGKRHRTRQANIKDEDMQSAEGEDVELDELEEDRKSDEEEEPEAPKSPDLLVKTSLEPEAYQGSVPLNTCFVCEMPNCGAAFSSMQALNGHGRIHGSTNQASKPSPRGKPKAMSQSGYGSVKSSPAHSTTSGETDPTLIFPCKECGKVFFKIKSRNAHMKTHRQQEEQERKKQQQQQQSAQEVTGPIMLPLDHMCLIKQHGARSEELHANLLPAEDMENFLLDCEEGL
ncbi:transcriptional-regulating factor 1-like isoform X3 [Acipenser ruthenus]|uniref:transcriptional-regulating factor 1-like isoform X3 n=1 Tax=Acipenser ruthenus TaxID=7906 RepID=UPI00145C0AFD|nr:transcriptional-regulating factor 1-like isoform X3 [Acipenser ruthenus]